METRLVRRRAVRQAAAPGRRRDDSTFVIRPGRAGPLRLDGTASRLHCYSASVASRSPPRIRLRSLPPLGRSSSLHGLAIRAYVQSVRCQIPSRWVPPRSPIERWPSTRANHRRPPSGIGDDAQHGAARTHPLVAPRVQRLHGDLEVGHCCALSRLTAVIEKTRGCSIAGRPCARGNGVA